MKKPTVILATTLSTVALVGAVGVGVAAADPSPSPTAAATPGEAASRTSDPSSGNQAQKANKTAKAKAKAKAKARKAHPGRRDLTRRALHGEVTLGGQQHRVVDFQRGTVSAVSASSITVRSADAFSATYVVDAGTKVRQTRQPATIGEVKTGDRVRVVALVDGSTLTAKRIADRTK